MADLFERAAAVCVKPKEASNWIMGETMAMMKEKAVLPENLMLSGEALGAIIRAVADGRIAERDIDAHVLRILRYKQAQGWIE